jgi:hypothetical protein
MDKVRVLTISKAPRKTPQRTLLNRSPPSRASSGNSTNSASGFSSSVSVKEDPGACELDSGWGAGLGRPEEAGGCVEECVTLGVMLRNDLNPT